MGDHDPGRPSPPEAPTTPFRRVVPPGAEVEDAASTAASASAGTARPASRPSSGRRPRDVRMRTVWLFVAIVATVLAVIGVFALFSGDRPQGTAAGSRTLVAGAGKA